MTLQRQSRYAPFCGSFACRLTRYATGRSEALGFRCRRSPRPARGKSSHRPALNTGVGDYEGATTLSEPIMPFWQHVMIANGLSLKLETRRRTRWQACPTEFHHNESNRFGMCSFDSRRGFEFFRRNSAVCPRKNRRCGEESPVRARRDADAADGPAKKLVHQAMSSQQRTAG